MVALINVVVPSHGSLVGDWANESETRSVAQRLDRSYDKQSTSNLAS